MNYAVTGSGASPANAADFATGVLPSGTVNFAATQTSQVVTINVSGDASGGAGRGLHRHAVRSERRDSGTATALGTIQNDDAITLSIAATDAARPEGNAGSTAFTFTVTRSGDTSGISIVNYAVTGSSASPADARGFPAARCPAGRSTSPPRKTSVLVTINVSGDTAVEPNEGFTVTLSGAIGGTLGTATALGTIQNDDASLSIAATDAVKPEGNAGSTAFTFTVTRSGDTSGISSVNYAVTGSGASPANAADFATGVLPSGTVNFVRHADHSGRDCQR